MTNSASGNITGGLAGSGGNAQNGLNVLGGNGGNGGTGVNATGATITNNGAITGGAGSSGGSGNAIVGSNSAIGGNGGAGGSGINGSGIILINTGIIAGGMGGNVGGSSGYAPINYIANGNIGSGGPGIYIATGSSSQITNTGSIKGGSGGTGPDASGNMLGATGAGVSNAGTVSTLSNSQGVGNASGALTYTGILPTNYNIIINSASSFGQLSASSVTGSTTFGITSSTLAVGTYSAILSGLVSGNIISSSLTGTYGSYSYSLVNASGTNWNLVVTATPTPTPTPSGGDESRIGSIIINSPREKTGGSERIINYLSNTDTFFGFISNIVLNSGSLTSADGINGSASSNPNTTVVISAGSVVTGTNAVTNSGITAGITNDGIVSGTSYGIYNAPDATIVNLTNNGIISGGVAGIANLSPNTIKLLVNTGTILGGIDNTQGRIITLQNAQGGTIPLALSGNLPNNYQVIVNGLRSYGQLAVTKAAGQMTFGIAPGSEVYSGLTYTSVLTGVGANNLLNTAGSGGGYLFKLTPETSGTIWNMTIGASVVDTQSSLQSTTSALQNQYASQSNGVIAGLTYDCSLFGENGICISAGGRQTGSSSFINGTTSALLIGAYRVNEKVRVGAYLDQNLSASNPNGIISNSNSTPMGGLFAVWNDRDDGLGTEVKASLGYNNKGMTITRPVVGTSEPGSGSTALTSQGANVVAKYNFGLDSRTTVSPYVGARYLTTVMNGYSEGQASNVLVPLAYSSLSMNATSALAGVGANHRLDEEITLSASAGMEADVQTTNGSYTVTNVNGLSPVALNPNPNKVRPTATAAAYYKLHKDAQIGLSVLYRQDSMTGMSSTTGMVTYTMGM